MQVMEVGAQEIADGINLICISRNEPPPVFSRLVSTARVASIEWLDLKLTLDETRQIAAVKQQIGEVTLARLFERCGGWAAGLTLMLERVARVWRW